MAAAEDALSEAFAAALSDWPRNGCPQNPEAWLMTVARRKFLDASRSTQRETASDEIEATAIAIPADEDAAEIPDRRLGLMFACAHPAIDRAIRAPLMLQAILGLDAARIASAFLISPATMSQRLVRAKNKIRQAGIPLDIPGRSELPTASTPCSTPFTRHLPRAGSMLPARMLPVAIWLKKPSTWAASRHRLLPDEPEGLGLLALMLHAEARRQARRNPRGRLCPARAAGPCPRNAEMIAEAESLLHRAGAMNAVGRYQLEAAIQSAHAARARAGRSDWAAIVQLYDALIALSGSPVAAVNRALAVAELHGPQALARIGSRR